MSLGLSALCDMVIVTVICSYERSHIFSICELLSAEYMAVHIPHKADFLHMRGNSTYWYNAAPVSVYSEGKNGAAIEGAVGGSGDMYEHTFIKWQTLIDHFLLK